MSFRTLINFILRKALLCLNCRKIVEILACVCEDFLQQIRSSITFAIMLKQLLLNFVSVFILQYSPHLNAVKCCVVYEAGKRGGGQMGQNTRGQEC